MASLALTETMANISGQGLTIEERAALEVGMQRRTNEEGLANVMYWGKITGTDHDYHIAIGYLPAKGVPTKKFFFCTTNNLVLQAMPDLPAEFAAKCGGLTGRFKGDPSLLLEGEDEEDKGDEEDEEGADRPPKFSEVHRLAYTVQAIENDAGIIPKGAVLIDAKLMARKNLGFTGLTFAQAGSLENYQHVRNSATKDVDEVSVGVNSTDFLDVLSDDEPRGVWSLRTDASTKSATIRSLQWPGYFFYHKTGTPVFASTYMGTGLPNADIGFML